MHAGGRISSSVCSCSRRLGAIAHFREKSLSPRFGQDARRPIRRPPTVVVGWPHPPKAASTSAPLPMSLLPNLRGCAIHLLQVAFVSIQDVAGIENRRPTRLGRSENMRWTWTYPESLRRRWWRRRSHGSSSTCETRGGTRVGAETGIGARRLDRDVATGWSEWAVAYPMGRPTGPPIVWSSRDRSWSSGRLAAWRPKMQGRWTEPNARKRTLHKQLGLRRSRRGSSSRRGAARRPTPIGAGHRTTECQVSVFLFGVVNRYDKIQVPLTSASNITSSQFINRLQVLDRLRL